MVPLLILFYYSRSDREALRNIRTVREYCRSIVEKRRKNPIEQGADLVTILLEDKLETELIIDECITFFLAGSHTVKVTNANIIMHLALNPNVKRLVMEELQARVFQGAETPINIRECFTYEKI